MTKKVAKKMASNRESSTGRIYLADWLREAHPDIYKQYEVIKDIEESVEMADHLQSERLKRLVESWQEFERNQK